MSPEASRRRKEPKEFSILIVPNTEGSRTRSFRATPLQLWAAAGLSFLVIVGILLAALMFTPLPAYLSIPNPELERKYGREIVETQERLKSLAESVVLLKDYNNQLRKALGDKGTKDTSSSRMPTPVFSSGVPAWQDASETMSVLTSEQATAAYDEYDNPALVFNAVVTSAEGFRAAFPLVAPTEGYIAQGFDPAKKHFGVDFSAKGGTPVYAAAEGHVMFSGWTYDDGNMVIILHGGGYATVYKHNQSLLKSSHTFVKRGEAIALVGSTGRTSLGTHLHFEVWKDGLPLDPNDYLLTTSSIQ